MANIPTKDSDHINSSYSEHSQSYADYWSVPFSFTEVDRREFESLVPPNGSILDVGCGPGNDAAYFAQRGYSLIGIDLSEPLLEIAAQRAPKASFMTMDMSQLDFEAESFDGVWASFSFLHIKMKRCESSPVRFSSCVKKKCFAFFGIAHARDYTLAQY